MGDFENNLLKMVTLQVLSVTLFGLKFEYNVSPAKSVSKNYVSGSTIAKIYPRSCSLEARGQVYMHRALSTST